MAIRQWENTCVSWASACWNWSDCGTVVPAVEIPTGVDAQTLMQPWLEEPWNPYRAADKEQAEKRRKKLIKLVCKVRGQEYNEEKTPKDFKVTVDDIKMLVNSGAKIGLDLKKLEE